MSKKKHEWDFLNTVFSLVNTGDAVHLKHLDVHSRCIIVFGLYLRSSSLRVILIHSLNPHCRLCLRPERRVWIRVSCWVTTTWNSTLYVCLCARVFAWVCVGLCVCVVSQNAPCGRARPWASVRRVCARLSPLCPLKRCRPRLSSFSRSVSPPLTPLAPSLLFCSTSSLLLLLSSPIYFSVWCSLRGSVQGIIHPTPVCPDHSPPLSPPTLGCTLWPSSPLPSPPLNQIKGSGTRAPAH